DAHGQYRIGCGAENFHGDESRSARGAHGDRRRTGIVARWQNRRDQKAGESRFVIGLCRTLSLRETPALRRGLERQILFLHRGGWTAKESLDGNDAGGTF